jgi:hypothetical protein
MKSQKTLAATVALFLLICSTGCIPGITWLPDSSGFVYRSGQVYAPSEERIERVYFDLATKKQRAIVDDNQMSTIWPAVSPDGKSVAVARLIHDEEKGDTL